MHVIELLVEQPFTLEKNSTNGSHLIAGNVSGVTNDSREYSCIQDMSGQRNRNCVTLYQGSVRTSLRLFWIGVPVRSMEKSTENCRGQDHKAWMHCQQQATDYTHDWLRSQPACYTPPSEPHLPLTWLRVMCSREDWFLSRWPSSTTMHCQRNLPSPGTHPQWCSHANQRQYMYPLTSARSWLLWVQPGGPTWFVDRECGSRTCSPHSGPIEYEMEVFQSSTTGPDVIIGHIFHTVHWFPFQSNIHSQNATYLTGERALQLLPSLFSFLFTATEVEHMQARSCSVMDRRKVAREEVGRRSGQEIDKSGRGCHSWNNENIRSSPG